ncbi:hypothetical protein GE21DRAFT_1094827 [Neurospora crassa]|nr:hypothetical protein GE21DRAFT_1094827 [Neurospora crassa]
MHGIYFFMSLLRHPVKVNFSLFLFLCPFTSPTLVFHGVLNFFFLLFFFFLATSTESISQSARFRLSRTYHTAVCQSTSCLNAQLLSCSHSGEVSASFLSPLSFSPFHFFPSGLVCGLKQLCGERRQRATSTVGNKQAGRHVNGQHAAVSRQRGSRRHRQAGNEEENVIIMMMMMMMIFN